MMVLDHSQFNFCLVLLLTSFAFGEAQKSPFIVRPIRHSLPGGLQAVNGSSRDGGCTSRNGSICNLQDGGTSVLFDSTIPPLSGLEGGKLARDLFTVRRSGRDNIVIGFDFGNSFQLRRAELVLFNCPVRSVRAPEIQIYGRSSTDPFPLLDPASGGAMFGSRLVSSASVNSCENLYRICVPITIGGQFPVYYIVIPYAIESEWVYLAEARFYNHATGITCDHDHYTLVTEPVTPPEAISTAPTVTTPIATSDIGIPRTIAPEATDSATSRSQSGPTTTSSPGKETNPASGENTITISVIVVIIVLCVVAVVSAVVIIFWVRRRQKLKSVDMNGSTPDNVGEMYAVVQKPKKTKDKLIPEDEDAPPIPPHTAADTYAVVNKKPKGAKKEGKVPPSSPPDNVGEMYAVVKKPEDESEPPPIPPHTVDALYSC